jgi:hypothetical protein
MPSTPIGDLPTLNQPSIEEVANKVQIPSKDKIETVIVPPLPEPPIVTVTVMERLWLYLNGKAQQEGMDALEGKPATLSILTSIATISSSAKWVLAVIVLGVVVFLLFHFHIL